MAEALAQAGLKRVVAGVCDTGNLANRAINAIAGGVCQRTSRIEATVVNIAFRGNRTRHRSRTASAGSDRARDKGWRIAFNKSRQPHPGGANIADLKEPVLA